MQKRILDNPKVKILWNNQIEKINGKEKIESVVIGGKIIATDGLFFAIGHTPATEWLIPRASHVSPLQIALDENGYIKIGNGNWPTMTSVAGVFGAGDCVDHRYRQAATAVGMGVAAALDCERWLEAK